MSKRKVQIEETTFVLQPPKKKSRIVKVRFIFALFHFHFISLLNTHIEFDLSLVAQKL